VQAIRREEIEQLVADVTGLCDCVSRQRCLPTLTVAKVAAEDPDVSAISRRLGV